MTLRRAAPWLLALHLCATPAFAIDPLEFKDRAEEVRFQNLTRQLRCLVCQNQNLADSDAELAHELRQQVYELMRNGKSDEEIKRYLAARYNDFVLYDPPLKPATWLLWFAPGALLVAGAGVLVHVLRRRARAAVADLTPEDDW
jgi:cytochrome c-type biogenesis protein CcmH